MKRRHDNSVVRYSFTFDELHIDPMDVLSMVGYHPDRIPPFLNDLISDIFADAASKCAIQGGYRIIDRFSVSENRQTVRIGQRVFTPHKIIATQLKNARHVAIFACTAGNAMENWSKVLLKGDEPTKGYMVDTLASLVVEAAMDMIHDDLAADWEKQDLRVSNRFSPGYCQWPLTEAHPLVSMLPPGFCNISLNNAAFMTPAKSICGIIGIGREVKRSEYPCGYCDQDACAYKEKVLRPKKMADRK